MNGLSTKPRSWDKLSCVPFPRRVLAAWSFSRQPSHSFHEGVHLQKGKALGAVQVYGNVMQEANARGSPLLGLIKERFQTVPFQQGVLK